MRAVITVQRNRPTPGSHLVGPEAAILLQTLPGVSEICVEREDASRATISYRWKDPGVLSPGIEAALLTLGIRLI